MVAIAGLLARITPSQQHCLSPASVVCVQHAADAPSCAQRRPAVQACAPLCCQPLLVCMPASGRQSRRNTHARLSGFEVLQTPLLAHGAGRQIKLDSLCACGCLKAASTRQHSGGTLPQALPLAFKLLQTPLPASSTSQPGECRLHVTVRSQRVSDDSLCCRVPGLHPCAPGSDGSSCSAAANVCAAAAAEHAGRAVWAVQAAGRPAGGSMKPFSSCTTADLVCHQRACVAAVYCGRLHAFCSACKRFFLPNFRQAVAAVAPAWYRQALYTAHRTCLQPGSCTSCL